MTDKEYKFHVDGSVAPGFRFCLKNCDHVIKHNSRVLGDGDVEFTCVGCKHKGTAIV